LLLADHPQAIVGPVDVAAEIALEENYERAVVHERW